MKKILVTITHVAEIEVDDRVTDADLEWATSQWDDYEDGRHPFFTELAAHACKEVVETFADRLRGSVASRICEKYPGARQRWYDVVRRLPEFKVSYRLRRSLSHRNTDGEEFHGEEGGRLGFF